MAAEPADQLWRLPLKSPLGCPYRGASSSPTHSSSRSPRPSHPASPPVSSSRSPTCTLARSGFSVYLILLPSLDPLPYRGCVASFSVCSVLVYCFAYVPPDFVDCPASTSLDEYALNLFSDSLVLYRFFFFFQ